MEPRTPCISFVLTFKSWKIHIVITTFTWPAVLPVLLSLPSLIFFSRIDLLFGLTISATQFIACSTNQGSRLHQHLQLAVFFQEQHMEVATQHIKVLHLSLSVSTGSKPYPLVEKQPPDLNYNVNVILGPDPSVLRAKNPLWPEWPSSQIHTALFSPRFQ